MPNTNLNEDQVFAAFIDRLLQTQGITKDTNPQAYQTQAEQLRIELDEAIQREVLNSLSTSQLEQLEQMFDANATDEDIEKFFDNANINYEQAVAIAMKKFREERTGGAPNVDANTNTAAPSSTEDMTNTLDNTTPVTTEVA